MAPKSKFRPAPPAKPKTTRHLPETPLDNSEIRRDRHMRHMAAILRQVSGTHVQAPTTTFVPKAKK